MSTTANLPAVAPVATTRLNPMPVFYDNALLSLAAVMWFPDDLALARKCVAHLLSHGTLQSALGSGIQIDNRYMSAILDDLKDGQPDQRLVARRRYWASAVGQTVKVLFALINSNDERVRQHASWEQAVKIAERYSDRTIRKSRSKSSFRGHLHRYQAALHICGAFEMAREETARPPMTASALMLNAMTLFERLKAWDTVRRYPGSRADLLIGDIYWRWRGSMYDDHGVADIGIPFDSLVPPGKGGRPLGS
jgi:hypothetical protein